MWWPPPLHFFHRQRAFFRVSVVFLWPVRSVAAQGGPEDARSALAALPVATAAASGSMDGGTKERRKVRLGRNLVQLPAPKKGA